MKAATFIAGVGGKKSDYVVLIDRTEARLLYDALEQFIAKNPKHKKAKRLLMNLDVTLCY